MTAITTRAGKGSLLTNAEVDANFNNLNGGKVEKTGDTMTGALTISNNAPIVVMRETDQTLPAGLWRIVADGDQWQLRKNTALAGDFSTEVSPLIIGSGNNPAISFLNRPSFNGSTPWDSANLPQPMVRNGYNALSGAVQIAFDSTGIAGGYALGLIYMMGANQKGGIGALGAASDANNWQTMYLATGANPYDEASSPSGIWADYSGALRTKGTWTHSGSAAYISNAGGVNFTLATGGATGIQNIMFYSTSANRFAHGIDGGAEIGGNTGANFAFFRYADNGAFIDTPLVINRASGAVSLTQSITAPLFRSTTAGPVSAANNTATTIYTFPNVAEVRTYAVNVSIGSQSVAGNYHAFGIVITDGTTARLAVTGNASLQTISLSGLSLQTTQNSGAAQNCYATITRIG